MKKEDTPDSIKEALMLLKEMLQFFKHDLYSWQAEEAAHIKQKLQEEQKLGKQSSRILDQQLFSDDEAKQGNANRSLLNPLDDSMIQEQSASRRFIEKIYQRIFPRIIEVILKYSSPEYNHPLISGTIRSIDSTLLELVLGTMINKSEFQNIFGELKKQFKKEGQTVECKKIIINWFTSLFRNFKEELIDKQTDVFEELISSLNFKEQDVSP